VRPRERNEHLGGRKKGEVTCFLTTSWVMRSKGRHATHKGDEGQRGGVGKDFVYGTVTARGNVGPANGGRGDGGQLGGGPPPPPQKTRGFDRLDERLNRGAWVKRGIGNPSAKAGIREGKGCTG